MNSTNFQYSGQKLIWDKLRQNVPHYSLKKRKNPNILMPNVSTHRIQTRKYNYQEMVTLSLQSGDCFLIVTKQKLHLM